MRGCAGERRQGQETRNEEGVGKERGLKLRHYLSRAEFIFAITLRACREIVGIHRGHGPALVRASSSQSFLQTDDVFCHLCDITCESMCLAFSLLAYNPLQKMSNVKPDDSLGSRECWAQLLRLNIFALTAHH